MPADDYTSSTIRGSLKLKGGPSKPEGVKKKKKKKPILASSEPSSSLQKALEGEASTTAESGKDLVAGKREKGVKKDGEGEGHEEEGDDNELDEQQLRELEPRGGNDGKTASERAYEEMRRKRLHERIQKEGPKTHKQRVEELNKYLSNLSEHHDMPKIGPG